MLPFDDRDGKIWLNGSYVPWREGTVHFLSHGLHYASLVFEGCRAYNGHVFRMREHYERLHKSAQFLDFEIPYSVEVLEEVTLDLLQSEGLKDAYIRPAAWRGSGQMGVTGHKAGVSTAIACWEWPSYFSAEDLARGIRLKTSAWRRPAPDTAPVQSKAAGLYMICTLSKHQAEAEGYDDSLMLDWRGYLAEATGANLFLVIDGALHTPIADCFLDGITRRTVIALAHQKGIKVVERRILPEELSNASEVFICGTAAEVTPVRQVNDLSFTPSEITKTLATAYAEEVRLPPEDQTLFGHNLYPNAA